MSKRRVVEIRIPKPQDRYSWGWIAWAAVSAGGFAVLEGYALKNGHHHRTLSVHTRRLLGIYPPKRGAIIGRAISVSGMACFCAWFSHHIAFAPGDDPRGRVLVLEKSA